MTDCVSCATPLILVLDSAQNEASAAGPSSAIPDDVTLRCACHFHWQCLVDDYTGAGQCPHCEADITSTSSNTSTSSSSSNTSILVTLHNEGGLQENLDIEALLREEVYLRVHPAEQQARAFLEFVRERDDDAVVQVLRDAADLGGGRAGAGDGNVEEEDDDAMDEDLDDDDTPQLPLSALLRYQDPLDGRRSALHIAVMTGNSMVVWVLLLLASELSPEAFPEYVMQTAMQMGFAREDQNGLLDIRGLQDTAGCTAWDLYSGGRIERDMPGFDVGLLIPP